MVSGEYGVKVFLMTGCFRLSPVQKHRFRLCSNEQVGFQKSAFVHENDRNRLNRTEVPVDFGSLNLGVSIRRTPEEPLPRKSPHIVCRNDFLFGMCSGYQCPPIPNIGIKHSLRWAVAREKKAEKITTKISPTTKHNTKPPTQALINMRF